jgi:hypothetical protein
MNDAHALSDHLALLLRREHGALAEFLLALARFDGGRRWRDLGYTSLFVYLNRHLRLSKGAAFYRSTAAALVTQFPEAVEPIRDGRLCLSNVVQLAKVVTRDNVETVLPRFFGISKDEAKAIVAELCPAEAPPLRELVTIVRPAPTPAAPRSPSPGPGSPGERDAGWLANLPPEPAPPASPLPALSRAASPGDLAAAAASPAAFAMSRPTASSGSSPREREVVEPLTADLRRVHVTLSKALLAKLDAARAALSHVIPDGDTEAVLDRALDLVLEEAARRRSLVKRPRSAAAPSPGAGTNAASKASPGAAADTAGAAVSTAAGAAVGTAASGAGALPDTKSHRPPNPTLAALLTAASTATHPRHIPAAVARAVWQRDGARCTYPLASGERCGATWRLELDHVVPFARGGPSTVDNLRVACAAHNQLAARQEFGDRWMDHCAGAAVAAAG